MATLRALACAMLFASVLGSLVLEAARQTDRAKQFLESYEQGVLTQVPLSALPALVSDLRKVAPIWVATDSSKSGRRRQLAALASLELAAALPAQSRPDLLEWACGFLREGKPDAFELSWLSAALGLMEEVQEYGLDNRPGIHARHSLSRFPLDTRLRLLEILTRPEATTLANGPVDASRLAGSIGYGESFAGTSRRMDIQDTMERLRKLSVEPFVGAEATIRLAVIEFLRGQTDSALAHLKAAVPTTDDSYLLNLDWLMQGLIATSRGDEPFALTAYRSAFAAQPTVTAASALAVSLFLSGKRVEAASILGDAYKSSGSTSDPWRHPVGLERHVAGAIDALRTLAGLPPIPRTQRTQPSPNLGSDSGVTDPARNAVPAGGEPQSPATPMFAASTSSVMVDVAVLNGKVPVQGLEVDDFEIFDNEVRQTVAAQSSVQVPLDVTIVLEMNERQAAGQSSWSPVQALKDVIAIPGLLRPVDRIRLLLASAGGPVEAFPLQPVAGVGQQVVQMPSLGISNRRTSTLFDATVAGLITTVPANRRSLLLAFTDGIDGASVLTSRQLSAVARESDAVVYLARRYTAYEQWMLLHPKSMIRDTEQAGMLRPAPPTAIEEVAEITGGLVRHPEATESLVTFFRQVLEGFRGRYVFHYTPVGVSDTGWHAIRVRLKEGRHRVIARRGYFAG